MALFGRKKPQELYAEAKKFTDLVYDWLRQPLQQYNFSVSDGVQTEYYLLAICSYLAQENISPSTRDHLHTAIVESSTYGKKYVKDKQKEYGFMACLLSTLKNQERDARRAKQNVLLALVTFCFRDFSKYDEPEKVKRCVYNTINQFNQEIPTTDYANLRLEVPVASPAAKTVSAPRTAAPKAAVSSPADDREFRMMVDGTAYHFLQKGKDIRSGGELYKFVVDEKNPDKIAMLHVVNGRMIELVKDASLRNQLCGIFRSENPEFAHLLPGGSSAPKAAPAPAPAPAPAAAPASSSGEKQADYTFRDRATHAPLPFNRQGRRMIYQDRVYELVMRKGGDNRVLLLDVTDPQEQIVGDDSTINALVDIFHRQNPDLSYILSTPKPEADLPDFFTIQNGQTGKSERVVVRIWAEAAGFLFAYCPRDNGGYKLIMRDKSGDFVSIDDRALTTVALNTMKRKYPAFF